MKKILMLLLCLGLAGCATTRSIIPGQYCDQYAEIISDPPGAKIEINNQYHGETPITIHFTRQTYVDYSENLFQGEAKFVASSFTIIANPILAGQFKQAKYIGPYDAIPNKIYFNMNLGPVTPSVDVNVHN